MIEGWFSVAHLVCLFSVALLTIVRASQINVNHVVLLFRKSFISVRNLKLYLVFICSYLKAIQT